MTVFFFFFNDTATTEIYTLSLHDALPIYYRQAHSPPCKGGVDAPSKNGPVPKRRGRGGRSRVTLDRKSTRLNSSHSQISYAVFCLKKKKLLGEVDQRCRNTVLKIMSTNQY